MEPFGDRQAAAPRPGRPFGRGRF